MHMGKNRKPLNPRDAYGQDEDEQQAVMQCRQLK